MALQFGKREKIVVGCVLGLTAILALHLLVFKGKSEELQQLRNQRNRLASQAGNLQAIPPRQVIEAYVEEGRSDEEIFWRLFARNRLRIRDPFKPMTAPGKPPNYGKDEKATEQYDKAFADYDRKRRLFEAWAHELVALHLERLVQMKKAFENGETWKGDLPPATENIGETPRMALAFLESAQAVQGQRPRNDRWNLPLELPAKFDNEAVLLDEINSLYGFFDVVNLSREGSSSYRFNLQQWQRQLFAMGLNIYSYPYVEQNGEYLDDFLPFLQARLVWNAIDHDRQYFVGRQVPLDMQLLRDMFKVELPGPAELNETIWQLEQLEILLNLARRNGIERIEGVRLPRPRDMRRISEDELATFRGEEPQAEVEPTPQPQPMVGLRDMAGSAPGFRMLPGAGMAPRPGAAQTEGPAENPYAGKAVLLEIRFVANNENAFRYLYDILNQDMHYRIEDLDLQVPRDDEKVTVQFSVQTVMELEGVSNVYAAGIFDQGKLKPFFPPRKKGENIAEQIVGEIIQQIAERELGWMEVRSMVLDQVEGWSAPQPQAPEGGDQ